jgi:hypothetical protein
MGGEEEARRIAGGGAVKIDREFDPVPHVHGWFPALPPTPCAAGAGALTNERIPLPLSSRDTRDFVATPRLPVALRLLTFLLVGCGGAVGGDVGTTDPPTVAPDAGPCGASWRSGAPIPCITEWPISPGVRIDAGVDAGGEPSDPPEVGAPETQPEASSVPEASPTSQPAAEPEPEAAPPTPPTFGTHCNGAFGSLPCTTSEQTVDGDSILVECTMYLGPGSCRIGASCEVVDLTVPGDSFGACVE